MAGCKKVLMLSAGLLLSFSVAQADSRYVTDSVSVAVFSSSDLVGEPVERILSGDLVELLNEEGDIIQIRTQTGSEGWVRASFLMSTAPAALTLLEVNGQLEALKQTLFAAQEELARMEGQVEKDSAKHNASTKDLGWLKAELKKTRVVAATAEKNLSEKTAELAQTQAMLQGLDVELKEVKNQNENVAARLAAAVMISTDQEEQKPSTVALSTGLAWGAIAIVVALGGGFFAGYRWLDSKVKRRFGGIKVY